ncbi:hypothetical protein PLESTB_001250000 [Pleodorina starrii]|uniref:Uncharacterized protein n=1 Tax=Pleodorina starrii TaxID=330485 RepID=A0A9W6BUC6_9CHLO|nr:hypothetical protein PLESTB_001250000 [Pleodorina starrii]
MVACVGALHDLYGSTRRRPAAAAGPTGWTCLRLRLLGRQGAEDPAEAGPGLLPVPPPSGPRAAPSAASQPGRASTAVDAGIAAGRQGQRSGSGAASSGQRVHSCSSNSHSSIGPSVRADGRAGEVADGGGNSGGGGGAWCGSGPEAAAAPAAAPLRGLAAVAAACLVLSLVAQLVAGPPVAAAVWRRRATLMAAVEGAAAAAERLLREQYDWLMTATPAGVKLHGELCALMGTAAHGGLTAAAAAARWGWRRCGGAAVGLLAAGFAVGGLGGGLSVAHDLLLAACVLPLGLQAALSGELLRRHLAWLGTAWQLMRGRQQRRGTRHRSHHRDQQRQPQGPEPLSSSLCEGPPVAGAAGAAGAAEVLPREPAAAAGAAAGPAPTAAPGAQRRRRWRDRGSLSSLFHRGAAAAGARRQGQGGGEGGGPRPLLPISRLESLLGLAPDPGSGDEVVIEQLIVGVLLGVPLLALLPTAAAWRALAVAAWGLPAAVRAGLAAAAGALRDNPVITLTWRALRPLDFAGPDIMVHCIPTGAAPAGGTPAAAGGPEGQGAAARDGGAAGCSSRGARAAGGGGGGGGVVFVVEPVPLPWGAVVGTWVARGLRGGWGDLPGAGAGAVEGEEQRRERRKAAGGVAARLRNGEAGVILSKSSISFGQEYADAAALVDFFGGAASVRSRVPASLLGEPATPNGAGDCANSYSPLAVDNLPTGGAHCYGQPSVVVRPENSSDISLARRSCSFESDEPSPYSGNSMPMPAVRGNRFLSVIGCSGPGALSALSATTVLGAATPCVDTPPSSGTSSHTQWLEQVLREQCIENQQLRRQMQAQEAELSGLRAELSRLREAHASPQPVVEGGDSPLGLQGQQGRRPSSASAISDEDDVEYSAAPALLLSSLSLAGAGLFQPAEDEVQDVPLLRLDTPPHSHEALPPARSLSSELQAVSLPEERPVLTAHLQPTPAVSIAGPAAAPDGTAPAPSLGNGKQADRALDCPPELHPLLVAERRRTDRVHTALLFSSRQAQRLADQLADVQYRAEQLEEELRDWRRFCLQNHRELVKHRRAGWLPL